MAATPNAITVFLQVTLANAFASDIFNPGKIQIDQQNVGKGGDFQLIGTAEEDLNFGDVVTEGLFLARNLDPANYIVWGPKKGDGTMQPCGKILPGEVVLFRLAPGTVIRAKADTAACLLDVRVYEN